MRRLDAASVAPETLLAETQAVLAAGGLVVFPTDTVYGVLCDPMHAAAVAQIYAAKGRPVEKPLILLFGTVDELITFTVIDGTLAAAAARRFLPGPLTLVVPCPLGAARLGAGQASLGVRVPDAPLLQAVLARTGPLASTSANHSGATAYAGAGDFALPGVDLFVDAGPTMRQGASTVIDFTASEPKVLREGVLGKASFATWLDNLRVV